MYLYESAFERFANTAEAELVRATGAKLETRSRGARGRKPRYTWANVISPNDRIKEELDDALTAVLEQARWVRDVALDLKVLCNTSGQYQGHDALLDRVAECGLLPNFDNSEACEFTEAACLGAPAVNRLLKVLALSAVDAHADISRGGRIKVETTDAVRQLVSDLDGVEDSLTKARLMEVRKNYKHSLSPCGKKATKRAYMAGHIGGSLSART